MKKLFLSILCLSCLLQAVPFTDKNGEEESGPDLVFISKPTEFLCKDLENRFEEIITDWEAKKL